MRKLIFLLLIVGCTNPHPITLIQKKEVFIFKKGSIYNRELIKYLIDKVDSNSYPINKKKKEYVPIKTIKIEIYE